MGTSVTVGTSSWADPGFVQEWYPEGLPARERLPWYAQHFDGVEVNATFYAVPARATVARWLAATPDHFTFDMKLHRALSRHAAGLDALPKDLRAGARTTPRGRVRLDARLEAALLDATLEAVEPLTAAGRLTSFLLQLTPAFSPKAHALDELRPVVERLAPPPRRHRAAPSRLGGAETARGHPGLVRGRRGGLGGGRRAAAASR